MSERDMYYNSYGYGGVSPLPNDNFVMTNSGVPHQYLPYSSNQVNDMNERINRLERQVKRLDQRLTRLETPYANNEPDNNMYMM